MCKVHKKYINMMKGAVVTDFSQSNCITSQSFSQCSMKPACNSRQSISSEARKDYYLLDLKAPKLHLTWRVFSLLEDILDKPSLDL